MVGQSLDDALERLATAAFGPQPPGYPPLAEGQVGRLRTAGRAGAAGPGLPQGLMLAWAWGSLMASLPLPAPSLSGLRSRNTSKKVCSSVRRLNSSRRSAQ